MNTLRIILIYALGLLPFVSFAHITQDTLQTSGSEYVLDQVLIEHSRIQLPFSEQNRNIESISAAEIQLMPVQNLSELLEYVSGIDIRQRGHLGAQADISINGGTFDQSLLLINGIKVIDAQTGHLMMNLPISLESIERIEVIKGPAAVAYGVNAINGAINIITKQPYNNSIAVQMSTGSSFKKNPDSDHLFASSNMGFQASLSGENTQHFLATEWINSNGYTANTSVDNQKLFYSNQTQIKNHNISFFTGYIHNDFGANGFYAAPIDSLSREKVQTLLGGLKTQWHLSDKVQVHANLSYRQNKDLYQINKHHPEWYENRHKTHAVNLELSQHFQTAIGKISTGLDYLHHKITSNSLGDHKRDDIGLFAHYHFDFITDFKLNLGVYSHYNKTFGWYTMPSLDLGYQLTNDLHIFANAGLGMRLPTYTDLYYQGPSNIGNPDLEPEQAKQLSLGSQYRHFGFKASAEVFVRETKDFIDWVKDDLEAPWQTLNYQNIQVKGFNLNLDYKVNTTNDKLDLNLKSAYTYLEPKIKQKEDTQKFSNYALENLRHQLVFGQSIRFDQKYSLALHQRYESRINYKEYILLDLRASTKLNDWEIFFDLSNITNKEIISAGATPLAGRWFSLGMRWKIH